MTPHAIDTLDVPVEILVEGYDEDGVPPSVVTAAGPMADTIRGLTDEQLADYEQRAEAAMLTALESVMARIASHLGATRTASALVAHLPGKHDQRSHGRGGGTFTEGAATDYDEIVAAAPLKSSTMEQDLYREGASLSDVSVTLGGFESYKHSKDGYREINGRLIRGEYSPGSGVQADRHISGIDGAMARSALRRDVVVHRGLDDAGSVFSHWSDGDMTGATFKMPGYTSTTANPHFAEVFAPRSLGGDTRKPVIMRIRAPKGTHGVALDGRVFPDSPAPAAHAQELLLARGLRFRVVADDGIVDGIRRLDVEVLS